MPETLRPTETVMVPKPERAGSSQLLFKTARTMNADPTQQEVDTWISWLKVGLLVDKALDENQGSLNSIANSILQGTDHPDLTEDTAKNCKAYLDNLPPQELETTLETLAGLEDMIAEYTQTTSAKRLVEIRLEEADYFSSFFKLSPRGPNDTPRARFNKWVEGFNRTGYLVDSAVDLRQDYEQGETSVVPTLSAKATIGQALMAEAIPALRATPVPVIFEAGRIALWQLSDRP